MKFDKAITDECQYVKKPWILRALIINMLVRVNGPVRIRYNSISDEMMDVLTLRSDGNRPYLLDNIKLSRDPALKENTLLFDDGEDTIEINLKGK